jgi:acetoin utilization deacetylase AcuC-like enzyme
MELKAQLTALIKPDIAVLEGGYSIEGALPYVNLCIVPVWAGLDDSHVNDLNLFIHQITQGTEMGLFFICN